VPSSLRKLMLVLTRFMHFSETSPVNAESKSKDTLGAGALDGDEMS
jgi:hypothetical protein